jgi:phosphoglycerate dehydrogenase-like enzyme
VESRLTVIQTEALSQSAREWLEERAKVVYAGSGTAEFNRAAPHAQALVVRTHTRVDAALLDQLPALRVVGRAGVGLDNIDLPECARRGIRVVNTPDANTQAVVEYVLCLLCDALRPRRTLTHAVDMGQWNALREQHTGERQMNELRLGILGMGRIGRRVAQVASAIGFHVAYSDLLEIPTQFRAGAECVSAEALFSASDVITLHIDGRPSNRHAVGQALLQWLQPHALLINTCRGMVIDNHALAAHLRAHPHTVAVLDVHEPEPIDSGYPLLGLPNARLAPHLASRTRAATDAMSWVVRDVLAALEGQLA